MRLASRVWLDPTDGDEPHVGFAALAESEGLIALTGGPAGPIDRALALGLPELAEARLEAARAAVRRPPLRRTAAPRIGERAPRRAGAARTRLRRRACRWSPTNEAYFAAAADYEAQDALLCVAEGALISAADRRRLSPEHRFKTRAEMRALFADLPEATRQQRRDRACAAPTGR